MGNMEFDLRSYLVSSVQLYSLAESPQLATRPLTPHLCSYTRALLVSQRRRHHPLRRILMPD